MQRLLWMLTAGYLLLCSCEDTLPFDEPGPEPLLAAYAFIDLSDTLSSVVVEQTLPFAEVINRQVALLQENAAVRLSRDGEPLPDFARRGQSVFYDLRHDPLGTTPANYRLTVTHPDFPAMTAEVRTPRRAASLTVQRYDSLQLENGQWEESVLEIRFNDPDGLGEYYEIGLVNLVESDVDSTITYWSVDSELLQLEVEGEVLNSNRFFSSRRFDFWQLSDENIDGGEVRLLFRFNAFFPSFDLRLIFRDIPKSHFDFAVFLEGFDGGLPPEVVAFPSVYSNFDVGLGVFSVYHERFLPID